MVKIEFNKYYTIWGEIHGGKFRPMIMFWGKGHYCDSLTTGRTVCVQSTKIIFGASKIRTNCTLFQYCDSTIGLVLLLLLLLLLFSLLQFLHKFFTSFLYCAVYCYRSSSIVIAIVIALRGDSDKFSFSSLYCL